MIYCFVEIEFFRFRPKTMDYSKAFSLSTHNSSLEGELKFRSFCSSRLTSTEGAHGHAILVEFSIVVIILEAAGS